MARKISVEIVGDSKSLEKAFAKSSRSAKQFQGNMDKTGRSAKRGLGGIGKVAGLAVGAIGVAGLAGAARAAFNEFEEANRVTAQTTAALESTGGAANVTAKQVDELANSMLKKTGIDDEAIKTSENMLLTFTNIRNEVGKNNKIFDRTTAAVADLATAMNQGAVPSAEQMQRASIQLGKALNDPIKGVGALARVGIQFTNQQKDQIKQLVKSGHALQAQKLILAEVNKEFGGRAAAAGKTFSGQMAILRETLNNLAGTLAEKLMPTIQKYLEMAVKWLNNSKNQKTIIDAVTTAFGVLAGALKILKGAFEVLSKVVGGNKNAIILLVAAYATFKVAQITSSVIGLASSFGVLSRRQTTAAGSARGLQGALGKAGLAAGVGVLSFELTTAILKLTGLDKKLRSAGGAAFDLASKLGLVGDAGKTGFEKLSAGQSHATARQMRRQAAQLEARGRTPSQAADVLQRRFPGFTRHDVEVAAGVGVGGVVINGGLHLHGVQNVPQLENELVKRSKSRPHPRRGP